MGLGVRLIELVDTKLVVITPLEEMTASLFVGQGTAIELTTKILIVALDFSFDGFKAMSTERYMFNGR